MCQGLATAASSVTGLTTTPYVPDTVYEPHFYVGEFSVDFDQTFGRGTDQAIVECVILASRADDLTRASVLAQLLSGSGSLSIKTALEAARGAPGVGALSGACDDFHVIRIKGYGLYEHAGTSYIGAKFVLRIIGDGA